MKKSILFMLINMNVGGTEKALLNMISEMPKEKFDITIFMLEEYGGFLGSIPSDVKVEYLTGYKNIKGILKRPLHITAIDLLIKGQFIKALIMTFIYFISKIKKERSLFYKYILREFPVVKNEYDIAVAYAGPMDFISYFIAHKIKAKKKIQWIHFDITKIGFNKYFAAKVYKRFDQIFVVSKEAKNKFISSLPLFKYRTEEFLNIISPKTIHNQAKESGGFQDNFEGLRILTVGRLSIEKGQDLAIKVLARLIKEGYKVKWYCVGEGDAREQYEDLIERHCLKDNFILLGTNPNPYPYIKQCDIYVQPSRYEGYCVTLMEARCLNKPILTTEVNGTKEQIKNEETGLIVCIDENEIYKALKKLIVNKELRNKFEKNLSIETFEPGVEMQKLIKLL
ncbi:glycosyltransferase [Cytobacillus firmus]|uniref:glycosyltransferase n=1 Tax=Cytobacillus firmus TaxID=1399 RepID=UPI0024950ED9|nr:glycosyltransferase [Cytobacillus firmus]